MPEQLWTVGQVAVRLGVSENSVRRWTDAGLIPAARLPGGARRYEPQAIERFAKMAKLPYHPQEHAQ